MIYIKIFWNIRNRIYFFKKGKKGHSEDKDILGFSSVPEKQICVSNHQCISNIKIVRGDKYVEGI